MDAHTPAPESPRTVATLWEKNLKPINCVLKGVPLAAGLLACCAAVHAAPIPGLGTWETTLQARDINADGNEEHSAMSVWAVHSGDVPTATIPEPQTYALMLAGLASVGFAARRRTKSL